MAKLIDLCNDYGMDAIDVGMSWRLIMEATERGYTNGAVGLKWGDTMKMVETVR